VNGIVSSVGRVLAFCANKPGLIPGKVKVYKCNVSFSTVPITKLGSCVGWNNTVFGIKSMPHLLIYGEFILYSRSFDVFLSLQYALCRACGSESTVNSRSTRYGTMGWKASVPSALEIALSCFPNLHLQTKLNYFNSI